MLQSITLKHLDPVRCKGKSVNIPLPFLIDEHCGIIFVLALFIAFQKFSGRDVIHLLLLLHLSLIPLHIVDINDELATLKPDRLHPEHSVVVQLVPEAGVARRLAKEMGAREVLGQVVAAEEALLAEVAAVAAALLLVHLGQVDLHLLRVRRFVGTLLKRTRLLPILRPEVHLK